MAPSTMGLIVGPLYQGGISQIVFRKPGARTKDGKAAPIVIKHYRAVVRALLLATKFNVSQGSSVPSNSTRSFTVALLCDKRFEKAEKLATSDTSKEIPRLNTVKAQDQDLSHFLGCFVIVVVTLHVVAIEKHSRCVSTKERF